MDTPESSSVYAEITAVEIRICSEVSRDSSVSD